MSGIGSYSVKFHPQGHVDLFTSEPLVYTNPHIWAAYLFVMILLGTFALYLFYQRQMSKRAMPDGEGSIQAAETHTDYANSQEEEKAFLYLKAKQDRLLQKIKALDVEFDEGKLEENEYKESREQYKRLLIKVKLQLKEFV